MTGNTRKSFSAVGVEGAVETGWADGAGGLSQNDRCGARWARDGVGETKCTVVTERARVFSGVGDRLASRTVVTSLAISVGSGEVGDGTSLAGRAGLAACVQGSAASGRIVGARRARLRIRSCGGAVVTSRADYAANTIDGSGNAGVADAPVSGGARKLGRFAGARRRTEVTRRARSALSGRLQSGNASECGSGASELRAEGGSSGAVETNRALTLASVVQLDSSSASVNARFGDIAIFARGAHSARRLSVADGERAGRARNGGGRAHRTLVSPCADVLSGERGPSGAVVAS